MKRTEPEEGAEKLSEGQLYVAVAVYSISVAPISRTDRLLCHFNCICGKWVQRVQSHVLQNKLNNVILVPEVGTGGL